MVKGIILAGGTGSRLDPCTRVTNKHLLNVWRYPMVYYPLRTLINAGITEILIVSGPGHAGHFVNLLGSGKRFGVKLSYEIQDEAGGIAQALSLAKDFIDNEKFVVILGDNIFEENVSKYLINFMDGDFGAKIFLKEVKSPWRFGVAEVKEDKIMGIEEKPEKPKTNYAVTGLYMYDADVFDIIKGLKPSKRGEYEITDVNNDYIKRRKMTYSVLRGFWSDAGTFGSLLSASEHISRNEKNFEMNLK